MDGLFPVGFSDRSGVDDVLGNNRQRNRTINRTIKGATKGATRTATRLLTSLLVLVLSFGLVACGGDRTPARGSTPAPGEKASLVGKISEVAPPETIQVLRQDLEKYQPQVKIVSPRPDEIINDDRVSVRFQVTDFPLFKSDALGLGPHLHVFLDNQPYQAVYDASEPIAFESLTPGTHTIRAFASRPWHESFKNEGAFAQVTFHVFAKTPDNNPDLNQPMLTYSRPQGSYGAEPVMLDFYLTNTPLHLIAQERSDDDISDWKIRCTVNGQSFVFDEWQPIYLKGLKPGKNWVQLELLDEKGNAIANAFNNTVRIVNYEPNGQDALSKLVRGDLKVEEARYIVDRNYTPPAPEPEPLPEPEPMPEPIQAIEPEPMPEPEPVQIPFPEPSPEPAAIPEVETPAAIEPSQPELTAPAEEPEPELVPSIAPSPVEVPSSDKPTGFFNRFRRPEKPFFPPPQTLPEVMDAPTIEEVKPEIEENPSIEPPVDETVDAIEPALTASEEVEPSNEGDIQAEEPFFSPAPVNVAPRNRSFPKPPGFQEFIGRFRRPTQSPALPTPEPIPALVEEAIDAEPIPEEITTDEPELVTPAEGSTASNLEENEPAESGSNTHSAD